jgi:hypothetical protein
MRYPFPYFETFRSHTLVADPDGLLLEEGILEGVRELGSDLMPFEDHIAFRYAYESKFRSCWDQGEHTDLVVILRTQASDLIVTFLLPAVLTVWRPNAVDFLGETQDRHDRDLLAWRETRKPHSQAPGPSALPE